MNRPTAGRARRRPVGRRTGGRRRTLRVRLRALRRRDLPRVLRIEEECFSDPWGEETFRALLRHDRTFARVAEVRGSVVGFAVLWFTGEDAELGDLAVAPGWRRRGVGGRLLETALRLARQGGARRMRLEVREGNRAARELYRGAGFRVLSRRPGYYDGPTEDALVMVRGAGEA